VTKREFGLWPTSHPPSAAKRPPDLGGNGLHASSELALTFEIDGFHRSWSRVFFSIRCLAGDHCTIEPRLKTDCRRESEIPEWLLRRQAEVAACRTQKRQR
jgi:hypothetical protein